MRVRTDWRAAKMFRAVTIGLSVTLAACGNSAEKALVGAWTHRETSPGTSEHQYSLSGDHTFVLRGAQEMGGGVQATVTGTWNASGDKLCLHVVSCSGSGCSDSQGGLNGRGVTGCKPYSLSGRTLKIIYGSGPAGAYEYEASTTWNRLGVTAAEGAASAEGTASNERNPSEVALTGHWTWEFNPDSVAVLPDGEYNPILASEFMFYGNRTFQLEKRGKDREGTALYSTASGTWSATETGICFHFESCTGSGCAALQALPAALPFDACRQYFLSDRSLAITGEGANHIR
jgi:hypothetical protein